MTHFLANRWLHTGLLLLLLAALVMFGFSDMRWRQQIRNLGFDYYNILKPRQSGENVVVVDIDEASLKEYGQMPWPRALMADLVTSINDMGALVIVFDIVFAEKDRTAPTILENGETVSGDEVFAEAIKNAGNVVTGFSFTNELTDSTPAQKGIFRGKAIEEFVPEMRGVTANIRPVTKYAAGNGSFFVSTDTDGLIRRVPMLVAHGKPDSKIKSVYPSLSLESVRVATHERGGSIKLADSRYASLDPERFGLTGIKLGKDGGYIPTTSNGEFLVYYAPTDHSKYISARSVLNKSIDPKMLEGKIVLIGTSAVGLKDIRSSPLETFIPGVDVHMNIIEQIMSGQYLRRPIEAEGLEAMAIFAAGLFIIVFSPFIGAIALSALILLSITTCVLTGWMMFVSHGWLLDVVYPVFCLLTLFMLSTVLTYLRTEGARKKVRSAFGLYISPEFMQELEKDPDKLKLGGEIRDLTVMFTDIRKFTSISEGLSPEELITLMNDFLTPMSDLVMQTRGTIDKYIGDAMMAFWNAPLDDEYHAKHACQAALKMQDALKPINDELEKTMKERGREPLLLSVGIGINTGPCAVGNMGSRSRFAYSALGDAVNLSSRLEGQTKQYGVPILIGGETQKHIPDMATLELDVIRVVGKAEPVRIFALLGDEEMAESVDFQSRKEEHETMLDYYRDRNFDAAYRQAQACMKAYPLLESVYRIYIERCMGFIKAPPPQNWDGVYEAKSK